MSATALKSLLESRWHGAAVHGHAIGLTTIATGIAEVDRALGTGGIPSGRLTEIFGERSSGKTTLAYALLAGATMRGDIGAVIDPNGSFFAPAADSAGINLERLIVIRPRDATSLRRAADAVVRSGACSVVVLDSARDDAFQTHHCARLVAQAEKTGTTLVALSHGSSQPLASFASLRIRTRGIAPLWQTGSDGGGRLLGYDIAIEIAKSRIGVPGRNATFAACMTEVIGSWPVAHAQRAAQAGDGEASNACAI